ncbi:MAG: zinc-dependent alcohol dehydrogenase family protein [Chlamydiia bacterium]|nr:zinc-dependent alcohol dehydrogenase family protein [Chlamydiia bacterium]
MKAMVLHKIGSPLVLEDIPEPTPGNGEIKIKIHVCGICRTDLHVLDGELDHPTFPIIPGHQIVGTVVELGVGVTRFSLGERVGVPWLGGSCGTCYYCLKERENLCDLAEYTGFRKNGGFAEYTIARADFSFPLPSNYPDLQVAPLLCAGLIGYRALHMTEGAKQIGFYGFGAAAHILVQIINGKGGEVFAFTKEKDIQGQVFAKKMGARWAGGENDVSPIPLDAAILFAPVGSHVPKALKNVKKGGIVVCAGIHMSDIPQFPYSLLWEERVVRSVANLTRKDGEEFLKLASQHSIHTQVTSYPLEKTNLALRDLRNGIFKGAAAILFES